MIDAQFAWDVVVPKKKFWAATAFRAIFLVPLAAGAAFGLHRFAYSQSYVKADELFIFSFLCLLGVLILINAISHLIAGSLPPKLIHFQVSREGIFKQKQTLPLAAFKTADVDAVLKQTVLPPNEWRQPRPNDRKLLALNLVSTLGKINLEFSDEYTRQQFIHTLKELL